MDGNNDQEVAALQQEATGSGLLSLIDKYRRLKRMIDIDNLTYVSAAIIAFVFIMPALYSTIVDKYWREHKEDKKMAKEAEVFK